eukprot:GHVS01085439.1.p1 GENE.GHVS01085439.1~~GHVS01085439.1.p1  ORF type:complete len:494 (+),score=83.21 GHVS01085439.1:100-1482(+)
MSSPPRSGVLPWGELPHSPPRASNATRKRPKLFSVLIVCAVLVSVILSVVVLTRFGHVMSSSPAALRATAKTRETFSQLKSEVAEVSKGILAVMEKWKTHEEEEKNIHANREGAVMEAAETAVKEWVEEELKGQQKLFQDDVEAHKAGLTAAVLQKIKREEEKKDAPNVGTEADKEVVDFSLHIVCAAKHWKSLRTVFDSLRQQTKVPSELILVLNLPQGSDHLTGGEEFDVGLLKTLPSGLNAHVYYRSGTFGAGNNRRFAADKSTTNLLSFFDCDDYMHPQRTELLFGLFGRHPEVDCTLHNFFQARAEEFFVDKTKSAELTEVGLKDFVQGSWLTEEQMEDAMNLKGAASYEEIRKQTPDHPNGQKWVAGDATTEPNQSNEFRWWLAKDMKVTWGPNDEVMEMGQNGWPTCRRKVIEVVQYPDITGGEDSLFNWRVIKSGFNLTSLYPKLGAYLFHY